MCPLVTLTGAFDVAEWRMVSNRSLLDGLHDRAISHGRGFALLAPNRAPCTYAALFEQVASLTAELSDRLAGGNKVIAIGIASGPDTIVAIVAAMSAGVCAPFDPSRPAADIDAFMGDIQPGLVLVDEGALLKHRAAFERYGARIVRISTGSRVAGIFELHDVRGEGGAHNASVASSSDEVLLVRTSGTTSNAKIIPHTMPRLMGIFTAIAEAVHLTPDDRCLNARPLHHLHAITHIVGASLVAGASIVCPRDTGGSALVRAFTIDRPTWYSGSPAVHRDVLSIIRAMETPPVHCLRFIRSSSAALDANIAIELEAALGGVPVLQGYGMSEAPAIALNPPPPLMRKPGSVGRALDCEVRILNGEVAVRGANVAPAYASRHAAQDIIDPMTGWFHTGDAGEIDADGFLFLKGRLNEIINVGGEKVSPTTVEAALRDHPAVIEAVAVPLPHPTLGQHVGAVVVGRGEESVIQESLIAYAATRLPRHAVPSAVHVVAAIPRDGNGKVQRRHLVTMFAEQRTNERQRRGKSRPYDDPLRHALTRIWEEILECPGIEPHENFFAVGGDSLRAVRTILRIEAQFGVRLSADTLLSASTIDALCDVILDEAKRAQPSRMIALRTTGSRPPLFFFDGDINGGGLYARFLTDALDPDQPIYVIRPYGVRRDPVPLRIEAMAQADAALIASSVPAGCYRVGGYCNGGVTAFEVARYLEAAGARVDVVALIASSAPNAGLDYLWGAAGFAARIARRDRAELYRRARHVVNKLRAGSLDSNARFIARKLYRRLASRLAPAMRVAAPGDDEGRETPEFLVYEDRLLRYFPRPFNRTVDLIWADGDAPRIPDDETMGWRHVSTVRRRSIGGYHTTMLTDHVDELAAALRAILDVADGTQANLLAEPGSRPVRRTGNAIGTC